VSSPPGDPNNVDWQLQSDSADWWGGTAYSSYLSAGYDDAAPETRGAPTSSTNVGANYQFIVTADNPGTQGTQYSIKVNAIYLNTVTGAFVTAYATLSFRSDPPAQASLYLNEWGGSIQTYISGDGRTIGMAILQLAKQPGLKNDPDQVTQANQGIRIRDATNMNTDSTQTDLWGGSFMFLQVANSTPTDNGNYWATRSAGNPPEWWFPLVGTGNNQDSLSGQLGYNTEQGDGGWVIADPKSNSATDGNTMHSMIDSPYFPAPPATYSRIAAGKPDGSRPSRYTTYLMFKPLHPDGPYGSEVWLAYSQITWRWSQAAAINNADPNPTISTLGGAQKPPQPVVASAVGVWPTWTGRTSDTQYKNGQAYNGNPKWPAN